MEEKILCKTDGHIRTFFRINVMLNVFNFYETSQLTFTQNKLIYTAFGSFIKSTISGFWQKE